MFNEFEEVVLIVDLPTYGVKAGDVGTIVDIDKTGQQVTLEVFALTGKTVVVVPVPARDVRSVQGNEIAHARQIG